MSLYEDAARLLENANHNGGSLKSRVFADNSLRNDPTTVFALAAKTRLWSGVVKQVVERSGLLEIEKKLSPHLALVLVHDLLLSKGGIAAPKSHPLRLAVEKHRTRLNAELNILRVKKGFATLEDLKAYVEDGQAGNGTSQKPGKARWIRVNTLKTGVKAQIDDTFVSFKQCKTLSDGFTAARGENWFCLDQNIPSLLAVPHHVDLSNSQAYMSGEIIFQDKASCFPAYLLGVTDQDGDIIDACAAPGNKTTHLAALISAISSRKPCRIFAFERDKHRTGVLRKMVQTAGAANLVEILGNKDFTTAHPEDTRFRNVSAILLDPSCSGSGIIGRDDEPEVHIPQRKESTNGRSSMTSRKRKRPLHENVTDIIPEDNPVNTASAARLASLSHFQLKLIEHAMRFPAATRITYSTCSVYAAENEAVVIKALGSSIAQGRGWRLLRRDQQVSGLASWDIRGNIEACAETLSGFEALSNLKVDDVADACIRCEKGTEAGTMGFFVAAFTRDGKGPEDSDNEPASTNDHRESGDEEEWNGFIDEEGVPAAGAGTHENRTTQGSPKKKKRGTKIGELS